jgi:hypothetical protein
MEHTSMDPETQTAAPALRACASVNELRDSVAGLRQSVRLLDAALEDLTSAVLRLHSLPALPCEHCAASRRDGFVSSCPEGCN